MTEMTASIKKFAINDVTGIKDYYEYYGYVVIKALLDRAKIDDFIKEYEKIKRNKFFIYYSQSLHLPLRPKITNEGFIEESMERALDLKFFPGFSQAILKCIIDRQISEVLSVLSSSSTHTLWQNMFFDKSTGTVEHQDHYYVDTNPPGNLIGAWYALEDIHPESGCFFVIPGSHKGQVFSRETTLSTKGGIKTVVLEHEDMRKKIIKLIQEKNCEYKAFPLNKGDVLFWHPYTIHGAYQNKNPQLSRKSFTAHFYPSHLERLDGQTPWLKRSANPNILLRRNNLRVYGWNVKQYAIYFFNKLRGEENTITMDMRRKSYEDMP